MTGRSRELLPWEIHCGCPKCKVKPRQRCITLETRYPEGWQFRDGTPTVGRPTTAHKARYVLWFHLFRGEKRVVGS